jgi:hypothetical protein
MTRDGKIEIIFFAVYVMFKHICFSLKKKIEVPFEEMKK